MTVLAAPQGVSHAVAAQIDALWARETPKAISDRLNAAQLPLVGQGSRWTPAAVIACARTLGLASDEDELFADLC